MSLPFRQIHLDFHTSEHVLGVGSHFSRENFRAALIEGHVSSITLFSKCHHGWTYHPTEAGVMHPTLTGDLLGEQLAVCRELGVRTEIYISAGFSEQYARRHPEHIQHRRDGFHGNLATDVGYHRLCFNTPYLDQLLSEVEEVLTRYRGQVDGLFLDIIGMSPCFCPDCLAGMKARGLDPAGDADAWTYARVVYDRYTDAVADAVARLAPGLPIIHNDGGAIFQGREIAFRNQGHFELESLPTGGWGYDHFPRAAAYARTLGREFLGMTGKFHRTWGEFGGYKHPNALRYEAALANVCGARSSVGDQLHPDGQLDAATYRLIGKAYREVEVREQYLDGATLQADIGLLSAETCRGVCPNPLPNGNIGQDLGANRLMLEGHYLYNILDPEADFSSYKLLILPDSIELPEGDLRDKLTAYVKNGGKLLLTGKSGTSDGPFVFDLGLDMVGENTYRPAYLRPAYDLSPNGRADYIMYGRGYTVAVTPAFDGQVMAERVDSYFNRTAEHFCSHFHTPYDREKATPAVFVAENIGYIGWEIFAEYADQGSVHLKSLVHDMIDTLLGADKTLTLDLPSCGVTSVARRERDGRTELIHQMAYAIPKVRGAGVEMIEDLPPVPPVATALRCEKKPARVRYIPVDGTTPADIPFDWADGTLTYTVPAFVCSAMVVVEIARERSPHESLPH